MNMKAFSYFQVSFQHASFFFGSLFSFRVAPVFCNMSGSGAVIRGSDD